MKIEAHSDISEAQLTAFSEWLIQEMTFRNIGLPEDFIFNGERQSFMQREPVNGDECWYEVTLSETEASGSFGNAATGANFPFTINLGAVEAAAADPDTFYAFCSGENQKESPEVADGPPYMDRMLTALFNAMMNTGVGIPTEFKLDGSLQFFDSVTHKEPGQRWYVIKFDVNGTIGAFGDSLSKTFYPFFCPPGAINSQEGHA